MIDRNPTPTIPDELDELAEICRETWPASIAALRSSGVPIAAGDDDDDDDKDGKGDKVEISKKEHDDLKEAVARKDKKIRELDAEAKERDERLSALEDKLKDAEAGDDEQKKLEARLERLEKRASDAEDRAQKAEKGLEASTRQRTALDVASRLKFRNPAKAVRLLDEDDLESEADAERALERLAREEPYLVSTKQRKVTDPEERRRESDDDDEEDDDDRKPKDRNGDEPTGAARIRSHYAEAEKKREKEREREAAAD